MKTAVFKDYEDFLQRDDRTLNGVSLEFAEAHPDYEQKNATNTGCWNCSDCSRCWNCSHCSHCSDCSRCSRCSGCSDCSGCSNCSGCSRCSGCSDCSRCSRCSGCSDCSGCSNCSGCSGKSGDLVVPQIENIHQRVLEATTQECALDMSTWHTCETTHCRAGWVVTLAGEQGKDLESKTSTEFAAMMIYKASSPIRVSPARFYEDDETAMEDIRRCAELEAQGGV